MNHDQQTLPLHPGERHFARTRLICAREFRGLTQKVLAEQLGLSSMAVSAYEKGQYQPVREVIADIAAALQFPLSWFFRDEMFLVSDQALSYRGFARMTSQVRDRSRQTWNIAAQIRRELAEIFELPAPQIPDLSGESPECAAQILREMWDLGDAPISNMVHLLESKGVAVFWTNIDSRSVDAYCNWHDDWPLVVLKSLIVAGERGRYNGAHELGHLVLHRELDSLPGVEDDTDVASADFQDRRRLEMSLPRQEMEKEANRFAAAFLLPEIAWNEEAPLSIDLDAYLDMKCVWGVSVQAMLRRSYSLEIITERQYESAMTQVSLRKWRLEEPEPVPVERSLLHERLFEMMIEDGLSVADFAQRVGLTPTDLEVLMPLAHLYQRRSAKHSTSQLPPLLQFPLNSDRSEEIAQGYSEEDDLSVLEK